MKTLLYIAVAAGAVYAASIITPDELKNKLLAAIGLNDFSVRETIFNAARDAKDVALDKLIPKSPAEKRAELIERLERSLAEIKEAQEKYADPKVEEIIEETQGFIVELKQENQKSKESALGGLVRAASEAINNIAGTNREEICK